MARCIIVGVLLMTSSLAVRASAVIIVNSECGNDSSSCLISRREACKTLGFVMTHLGRESNLEILLETDTELHVAIQFENISNVTITGLPLADEDSSFKQLQCFNQSNLHFKNVSQVTISNIKIVSCGILDYNETRYEAALFFENSSDITLRNTTVSKSRLTGVTFLACSGEINLQRVHLIDNGHGNRCPFFPAGASIEITNSSVPPAHYTLRDCDVKNNTGFKYNKNEKCFGVPGPRGSSANVTWYGRGLGGGIGVYFTGNCSNNSVEIINSSISDNQGKWGGGMYVQFQNITQNNTLLVSVSNFSTNHAHSSGGGVNIIYLIDKSLMKRTNRVNFSHVLLTNNRANYGGGLAISSMYGHSYNLTPGGNLAFDRCTLKDNEAVYGPAVDVSPYFYRNSIQSGFLPIPLFSNIEVVNNHIKEYKTSLMKPNKLTTGVFSVTQFTVHFNEKVNFTQNSFSALLLCSAVVAFRENTSSLFANNTNDEGDGGAIAMHGFSTLFVSKNTHFEFTGNKASGYGGAIFYHTIDQRTFITGTSCFIQFTDQEISNTCVEDRNITIIFRGNVARRGGSSIYADSFYSCIYYCKNENNGTVDKSIIQCIANITLDETSPNHTRLQSSSSNFVFKNSFTGELRVIPGEKRAIPFTVKDEFNQTVKPLLNLGVLNEDGATDVHHKYTLKNQVVPYGNPNHTATLQLITERIAGSYFRFNITFEECPPGFYFNHTSHSCVCSDHLYPHVVTSCESSLFRAYMKRDYWAGHIPGYTDLFFSPCFYPLCNSSQLLPKSSAELESNVCYENRKGIMCGSCIENHSVYYHTAVFLCRPNHICHLGPFFYLLSEILPVCILFAAIVIFDFSFTSGNTVGFIFFSQYLERLAVHIDDPITYYRKPYRIFYGVFNFEFFTAYPISFCLWKDMQILDIIFIKYFTILAALALVVALVSFLKSNKCLWLLKWRTNVTAKTSFVRGLSAFLVICYNQCTRTSFYILKSAVPSSVNGTTHQIYSYYGGLPYLEGRHLVYGLVAIFSLIFVTILPPFLLLLHPLSLHFLSLCNLSEHWIINKILKLMAMNNLMPFLDCFQSCYKDRLRFFAGLYFVYRVVILCTYTSFETYYGYRVSSEIALIMFLGIHAIVQPYKNRVHNLIDSLVFLNLALINAISIYIDFILQEISGDGYEKSVPLMVLTAIQLVLLYLPMIAAVVYIVVKVVLYCKRRTCRSSYEMLEE